jgi:hypothetical protein
MSCASALAMTGAPVTEPRRPEALRPIVEMKWVGGAGASERDGDLEQFRQKDFGTAPEIESAFSLHAKNIVTKWGTLELRGAAGEFRNSEAITMDRLESPGFLEQRTNTGLNLSVKYSAFADALVVSSAFAWAADNSSTQEFQDASLIASDRSSHNGTAQWHKLDATLIDETDLKWTMSGEWSAVDDDYFANASIRPTGTMPIAGERGTLATRLKIFGAQLAASTESLVNRLMERNASRLTFGTDGFDLAFREKDIARYSSVAEAALLSRKSVRGVTVEFMPELLIPETIGELGALSAFVPNLISLDWERGEITEAATQSRPDMLANAEILLSWSTDLGETTALFTQETQTREISGRSIGAESNRLIDISHTVREGAWRIGFGVSLYEFDYALDDNPFSDKGVSGSFSLAYAPDDGPSFKLAVGRNNDRFAMDDENLVERSSNLNLSLSADLSPYIQEELGQPDAKLVVEYRARLSDHDGAGNTDTDRNAFLVSFSTRF